MSYSDLPSDGSSFHLTAAALGLWVTGNMLDWASDASLWTAINGPLSTISFIVSIVAGISALYMRTRSSNKRKGRE